MGTTISGAGGCPMAQAAAAPQQQRQREQARTGSGGHALERSRAVRPGRSVAAWASRRKICRDRRRGWGGRGVGRQWLQALPGRCKPCRVAANTAGWPRALRSAGSSSPLLETIAGRKRPPLQARQGQGRHAGSWRRPGSTGSGGCRSSGPSSSRERRPRRWHLRRRRRRGRGRPGRPGTRGSRCGGIPRSGRGPAKGRGRGRRKGYSGPAAGRQPTPHQGANSKQRQASSRQQRGQACIEAGPGASRQGAGLVRRRHQACGRAWVGRHGRPRGVPKAPAASCVLRAA